MLLDDEACPMPDVSEDFVVLAFLRKDGTMLLACDTMGELCKAGTEVTAHLDIAGNQKTINFVLQDFGLGIVRDEVIVPSAEAKTITRITLDLPSMAETHPHQTWKESSLTLVPPVRPAEIVKSFVSLHRGPSSPVAG
ncbi:MAG: hypothetical protein WCD70_05985 [Alphaproteobacteria bacterium]